ncbi:MAG: acriflavin resistance protein [Bacteroidetes bacterium]|nr:acriflavin resistance protein [Bacteroidota bacterium]
MINKILDKKALLNTLFIAIFLGGLFAYMNMGKLEDAEIAIKSAVIVTPYPGADAYEVELEVTNVLENAIQRLENVDDIESRSMAGMSEITINIAEHVTTQEIPQMWDHLRRKIRDVENELPQGAMKPIIADDFGDVYGIFMTVTGQGFEYDEFYNYVDFLRREFLEIEGIKRVELFGAQTEVVDILFSMEKLANLGINPMLIVQAINDEGSVVNTGSIVAGTERIRLGIGNKFTSLKEIENVLIQVPEGGNFKLGDIVEVRRSFLDPKRESLTYNGERAISLALSMESGVNVVDIGDVFNEKLIELEEYLPAGIEVNEVFSQPERVRYSIRGFIVNLVESVLIVIVVLLFAMGIRSGLLIASGLVFTILGTFIIMLLMDMQLQRVSLAAIIVSMGMLVDNSIVIADGILIDLKKGVSRKKAFTAIVQRTALPLLGATVIAILAFWPLAMSPDSSGEYLSSLFYVLAISLFLSWVFAMIQTPYVAKMFLQSKKDKAAKEDVDPYQSGFYQKFKKLIEWALSHKAIFLSTSVVVLVVAFYSFRFVRFEFMPLLDYNQFVIEYKLPRGADLDAVEEDLKEISKELVSWDEIYNVTAATGRTPARYTLIRPFATGGSNYGELIIDVEDYDASVTAGQKILDYLQVNYPQAETCKRVYGPIFTEYEIEVQFEGPDPSVLRALAEESKAIMRTNPNAQAVTDNWKNKVKTLNPIYSVEKARKAGISRSEMSNALAIASEGMIVGVMHEGDQMLPISFKLDQPLEQSIDQIENLPVWGTFSEYSVPLAQLTEEIKMEWEDGEIFRYNGRRAIRAQCDPIQGVLATELELELKDKINAIVVPEGYTMTWKGSGEDSAKSQANLFKFLPVALGLMLLIVIALFNNIKQSLIIFTIFPFAFVGIVFGFVTTGGVFNFIGIIGALGLIGMMIKNSIVLLDEINQNLKSGLTQFNSIVTAVIARMRPVVMASMTTMLGMIPLLFDVMFKSMAITIIFGLLFGTIITLFVIPVMYASVFRVSAKS